MPLSMRGVRGNAVREPLFDKARDRPVGALGGHFDKLSANGGVRRPFGLSLSKPLHKSLGMSPSKPSHKLLGMSTSKHCAGTPAGPSCAKSKEAV